MPLCTSGLSYENRQSRNVRLECQVGEHWKLFSISERTHPMSGDSRRPSRSRSLGAAGSKRFVPGRTKGLFRTTDRRPKPDQLEPHGDDLIRQRSLRIRPETVTASKPLNGPLNFRQAAGDRRWNNVRIVHVFR